MKGLYEHTKFINRLLELMKDKRFSIVKLANATNIPRTTIGNWISRGTIPSINVLCVLAEYFCCSIDYLLGREE